MTRAALLQLTSSDDPAANAAAIVRDLRRAVSDGAQFALLPEVANCISASRSRQREVLRTEAEDATLAVLRQEAARGGIWLLACLALRAEPPEERFVNRCLLIGPDGGIVARYDKMHMFDVQVTEAETYRESAGYAPGDRAVLADTPFGRIGLTICYDLRFPYLYRALAKAGAEILTVPSAFSPATGPMHWEPLLRARAIETGAWILAPAQCGRHAATRGRARETWGHSLAVSPWGEVMADGGSAPGIVWAEIDRAQAAEARRKVPSLGHDRAFEGP